MKGPKEKNVLKVKQTTTVTVLTLSKSVARQFDRIHGWSGHTAEELDELLKEHAVGWVWCRELDWSTGQAKAVLVKFAHGDYRWMVYRPEMLLVEPPQIILTGR